MALPKAQERGDISAEVGAIKDCAPGVEKEGWFSTKMNRGQQMYLSYRLGGP